MATSGPFATVLRSLKSSRYLQGILEPQNPCANIKLLLNGHKFCELLSDHWRNTNVEEQSQVAPTESAVYDYDQSRICFVKTRQFACSLDQIGQKFPTTKKEVVRTSASSANRNGLLDFPHGSSSTQLVTDYFLHPATGFQQFHSIQRERKIWWMRCSANPSRYFTETFNLAEAARNCQSVTIKSRFPFGIVNLESVTLVPLKEAVSYHSAVSNARLFLPAVVRSVIDLEASACALLLDGCDHHLRPYTLLLNRKLAPFQCTLTCLHSGDQASDDFHDLCTHIRSVLQSAGLRLYTDEETMVSCEKRLEATLDTADNMGIPYALLIEDETLRTGLLRLRSRDTTLLETIHISDIPTYLLNIFR